MESCVSAAKAVVVAAVLIIITAASIEAMVLLIFPFVFLVLFVIFVSSFVVLVLFVFSNVLLLFFILFSPFRFCFCLLFFRGFPFSLTLVYHTDLDNFFTSFPALKNFFIFIVFGVLFGVFPFL
jgi:hypothetical protein